MQKVAPLFTKKGLEFKVEYVTSIRDWQGTLPNISTLHGAYRRRTIKDQDVIPHSFTFIRRECAWMHCKTVSFSPVLLLVYPRPNYVLFHSLSV